MLASDEHTPNQQKERERIMSLQGRVERVKLNGRGVGPFRVWLLHRD